MGRQQPEPPRAAAGRQQGQQRTSAYTKGMRPYRANNSRAAAARAVTRQPPVIAARAVLCTAVQGSTNSAATAAGLGIC
jgi:hypothetical protein